MLSIEHCIYGQHVPDFVIILNNKDTKKLFGGCNKGSKWTNKKVSKFYT